MKKLLDKALEIWHKYPEQLSYLFFGGVTTLVNIACYALLHSLLGMASDPANAIAMTLSIAVAYVTNRKWVFKSRATGKDLWRELISFVGARLVTFALDAGIMHLGTEIIGPRLMPDGSRGLWDLGVKVFSNILVILLNYVFSKLFIFKKKKS